MKKRITFYRAYNQENPCASDVLFPTKKARAEYVKATYDKNDPSLVLDEVTCSAPLTKESACRLYALALR